MHASDVHLPSAACRNVLVVDDETAIHTMFDHFLRPEKEPEPPTFSEDDTFVDEQDRTPSRNFNLFHAENGNEAVSLIRRRSRGNHPVQIAFVDLRMKDLNGIETIRQLQEIDPRLIFIVVSGFPDDAREKIAENLGAIPVEVIAKPFEREPIYRYAAQMCIRWEKLHSL